MSAFHANDLHREFVSSFHGIRWSLVQIAGRIFIALLDDDYPLVCLLALQFPTSEESMPTEKLKMPTSKSMPTSEELMMPTNESMMPTSETLMMPTSEESMPTEKLKMPTNEESMPTEELMPTQALKKRTKLARL